MSSDLSTIGQNAVGIMPHIVNDLGLALTWSRLVTLIFQDAALKPANSFKPDRLNPDYQ